VILGAAAGFVTGAILLIMSVARHGIGVNGKRAGAIAVLAVTTLGGIWFSASAAYSLSLSLFAAAPGPGVCGGYFRRGVVLC